MKRKKKKKKSEIGLKKSAQGGSGTNTQHEWVGWEKTILKEGLSKEALRGIQKMLFGDLSDELISRREEFAYMFIEKEDDFTITNVVEVIRNENSILHDYFQWDDGVAEFCHYANMALTAMIAGAFKTPSGNPCIADVMNYYMDLDETDPFETDLTNADMWRILQVMYLVSGEIPWAEKKPCHHH